MNSKDYSQEYIQLIEELDVDGAQQRAALRYMEAGSSYAATEPIAFSFLPRILCSDDRDVLKTIAEMTHGILVKVIRAYFDDEDVRALFKLDPRVEELIMLTAPCMGNADDAEILPYGRFDCFFDESRGSVRFVEFNTDCSSGMNKTLEAFSSIKTSTPYESFISNHRTSNDIARIFNGWVDDFCSLYKKTPEAKSEPHVAIIMCWDGDHLPQAELARYARLFEFAGLTATLCDVRTLAYEDGQLVSTDPLIGDAGKPIDAIWRYVVTVDLLEHWDECTGFIEAMRASAVPVIGSFATQIVHDKQLFALLRDPVLCAYMTPDEREFIEQSVPFTAFLDDPALDIELIKNEPARWVIKPTDWYSNIGVHVGAQYDAKKWTDTVEMCRAQSAEDGSSAYIVQEYCQPETSPVVALYPHAEVHDTKVEEFGCLTGMYVFSGQFAGLYNRLGPHADVTEPRSVIVSPTLWVQEP